MRSWKKRLKRTGSLQATVTTGRPSRLTATQLGQLRTLLREGALQHGFPDEIWTTRRVTDLIGRQFDVCYHHDHVQRNELRIASWRAQVAPELEKKGR